MLGLQIKTVVMNAKKQIDLVLYKRNFSYKTRNNQKSIPQHLTNTIPMKSSRPNNVNKKQNIQ